MTLATRSEPSTLADQVHRAFHGGAWHGPSLSEALAGVDAASAGWRPLDGVHCIAEITGHLAYWMEDIRRQIAGEGRPEPASDADWRSGAAATEAAWRQRLEALWAAQKGLAAALEAVDEGRLDDPVAGSDPTVRGLVLGLLQHNAYHAGQIALLHRQARAVRGGP